MVFSVDGGTISNNIVSDFGTAASATPDSTGINVAVGSQGEAVSDITITGNTVTDSCTGLCLWKAVDSIDVTDNTFSGCRTGVTILAGAPTNLTITGNAITGNTGDGILIASWAAANVITNNNISGNAGYGIENTTDPIVPVDARSNWWGDPTGPYSAPANDWPNPGLGDSISDHVDGQNYLTAAVTVAPTVIPDYVVVSTTGVGGYLGWVDSEAVTTVAFSPNFDSDETILVISSSDS
ncbi:unnamed protein product, partial [marine sediment metagenome]